MRKYGIPVLAAASGIGIGLLIATPRTPATAEAVREFSIAAIPGEKGGSDVFGPYDVVSDWPKPMSASLPGHENWTWGSAEGIFAESPDRVFGFQRGELPLMEEPERSRTGVLPTRGRDTSTPCTGSSSIRRPGACS